MKENVEGNGLVSVRLSTKSSNQLKLSSGEGCLMTANGVNSTLGFS